MQLKEFKESTEKQIKGAPVYIGDSVFYLRRYGTPESNEFLNKLKKDLFGPAHKQQQTDENLILAEWLIEYGCVGWDGLLEDTTDLEIIGKWEALFLKFKKAFGINKNKELEEAKKEFSLIPYSKQNARKIFSDKEYHLSLNSILFQKAINFENYLYDEATEDLEAIKKS